jgi:hypothetical protein
MALPKAEERTETMNVKRIAPGLFAEEVEPCVKFWAERMGFEKTAEVPDGNKFAFASRHWRSFDVLDPACEPGISHREPGGMTVRETIAHLHAIKGNIVGADVVEFIRISLMVPCIRYSK